METERSIIYDFDFDVGCEVSFVTAVNICIHFKKYPETARKCSWLKNERSPITLIHNLSIKTLLKRLLNFCKLSFGLNFFLNIN